MQQLRRARRGDTFGAGDFFVLKIKKRWCIATPPLYIPGISGWNPTADMPVF
jgi:hypothetical protein